jgi:Flp pilus assembly protein TadB
MKTLLRIFGILILLIATGICAMSIWRANEDREELAQDMANAKVELAKYQEQANQMTGEARDFVTQQIAEAEKKLTEAASPSTYVILEIFLSALLILGLAFGVFLFRPNPNVVKLLGVAAVLVIVTYFVSPDIKRGTYGGADSRTLALMSGIPVLIVGLLALVIARKSAVKN